jgi:hypothetical protein
MTENIIQPIGSLSITNPKPNYMLTFHKEGKTVGTFDFNEGRMHFEGDVSESGQLFVDWVVNAFKQRIEEAVKAEREACAKVVLADANDDAGNPYKQALRIGAEAIRAREQL